MKIPCPQGAGRVSVEMCARRLVESLEFPDNGCFDCPTYITWYWETRYEQPTFQRLTKK